MKLGIFQIVLACFWITPCLAETKIGFLGTEFAVFATGTEIHSYVLIQPDNSRIPVSPSTRLKHKITQFRGKSVQVKLGNQKVDGSREILTLKAGEAIPQFQAASTKRHKLVFVLVGIDNFSPAVSKENLSNLIYNGESPGFGSLIDIIRGSSRDLLQLSLSNKNGSASIFGPVTIQSQTGETCENSYRAWGNRARKALKNFKLNSSTHLMFIFPEFTELGCPLTGRGELFGTISWLFHASPNTIAHEFGHNLGFFHAGRSDADGADRAYGDFSSPMSRLQPTTVFFNAANIIQRGWMSKGQMMLDLKAPLSKNFSLSALESSNTTSSTIKILRLQIAKKIAPYIFSYRNPAQVSSQELSAEYSQGLSIHRDYGLGQNTEFVGALRDGESFVDLRYGIKITQMSHSSETVELKLELTATPISPRAACYFIDPCLTTDRAPSARNCFGRALELSEVSSEPSDFCPA